MIDVFFTMSQNFVLFQRENVFEFFEFRRHFFRDVVEILDENNYSFYRDFFNKLIWLNKNRINELMFLHFIREFFLWNYLKSILDEIITLCHNCIIQFNSHFLQFWQFHKYIELVVFVHFIKNHVENAFLLSIVF